jgi:ATP-dependent 26S proteasome regulatory subunit
MGERGRGVVSDASELAAKLALALRSGTRVLALITGEEPRALALLERVAESLDWPLHTWSAASGLDGGGRERELAGLLARVHEASGDKPGMYVLFDALASMREPSERRRLRELAQRSRGPALLLVEPRASASLLELPELALEVLPLPSAAELAEHVRLRARALRLAWLDAGADELARLGLGLELDAFARLLAAALASVPGHARPVHDDLAHVREQLRRDKPTRVARDGLLEPLDAVPITELGGLERYVEWLARRGLALAPTAREAGIPAPRGALLIGVQGCGKSLAARASAASLGLPLVRLELARLFAGTVGESEANLRRATATLERMAPVVAWLDELDKGLAGVEGARSDAGTAARVVGSLLTWLQEREQPVFVVATANRVDALPPELLRRGRLDELFFVDLPDADARATILAIHLETKPARLLGHVPPLADPREAYLALARAAEGFSGAELEAALIEARLAAFARAEPLAAADFADALAATIPLARSHAESIEALRRWATTRARRA